VRTGLVFGFEPSRVGKIFPSSPFSSLSACGVRQKTLSLLGNGRDSTSAGENPQPSTHFRKHPDSPSVFEGGAGSLEALSRKEETKK